MASLPIPSPPATPSGDRWVEVGRGDDRVDCASEDGSAFVSLQLVSDKDGRRWEWCRHYAMGGVDLRALAAEWEQSRSDGLDGFRPVSEPAPAAVPVREPGWYLGCAAAEKEPEPEPEPVPDVELVPAPGTLYDGVPVEGRRAFTRWLNG